MGESRDDGSCAEEFAPLAVFVCADPGDLRVSVPGVPELYFWFEIVGTIHRLGVVAVALFVSNHQAWLIVGFQVLFGLHLWFILSKRPLYVPFLNSFQATLDMCLVVLASIGFLFYTKTASSGVQEIVLIGALIGVLIAVVVFIIMTVMKEIRVRRRLLQSLSRHGVDGCLDLRAQVFLSVWEHESKDFVSLILPPETPDRVTPTRAE